MQNLYRHFDDSGTLLYVGVSLNSINRLSQHKNGSHWFEDIARVEIEKCDSRQNALEAETNAILNENPLHNVRKRKPLPRRQTPAAAWPITQPVYTINEAADALRIGPTACKRLIEEGKLGCIKQPNGRYVRTTISGWQLIDYIENMELPLPPDLVLPRQD